jgi:hypothetical protein
VLVAAWLTYASAVGLNVVVKIPETPAEGKDVRASAARTLAAANDAKRR